MNWHEYYELSWIVIGILLGFQIGIVFAYCVQKFTEKMVMGLFKKRGQPNE